MSLRIINKQTYLIVALAIIFFFLAYFARYLAITINSSVIVNNISYRIISKPGIYGHNNHHSLLQKSSQSLTCITTPPCSPYNTLVLNFQFLPYCERYLTYYFAQKYKEFISRLKPLKIT